MSPEPTCRYCGDGMESIGTLNHIECVASLESTIKDYRLTLDTENLARKQAEADNKRLRLALITIRSTAPGSAHRIAIQALGD